MQDYTRTLITEEMHLGALIEKAVKQIEEDRLKDIENSIDYEDEAEEDAFAKELFSEKPTLSDEDFEDFSNFVEDDKLFDKSLLDSLDGEDDI